MKRERWAPLLGYDGLYEVSDQGRVRSLPRDYRSPSGYHCRRRGTILRFGSSSTYLMFHVCRDGVVETFRVHREVLRSFCGEPFPGAVANHKNFDKHDNRLENLEWVTPRGNIDHAMAGGRFGKLTYADVKEIRRRRLCGERLSELASAFGVSESMVCRIAKGNRRQVAVA